MNKDIEQAKREFANKWSSCLVDIDLKAHKIQEDGCLSDLNALLEKYKEGICNQCREQHKSADYNPYFADMEEIDSD